MLWASRFTGLVLQVLGFMWDAPVNITISVQCWSFIITVDSVDQQPEYWDLPERPQNVQQKEPDTSSWLLRPYNILQGCIDPANPSIILI